MARDWKEEVGGFYAFRFCEKLKSVRMSLKGWYRERGKNSKNSIDKLKCELREAYQSKVFASVGLHLKERALMKAHKEEQFFWRVKSRVQ